MLYDIQISKHDEEGRVLTAEYEYFYLVTTYVVNSGADLQRLEYRTKEWDKDFARYLKALEKRKPVILSGDLNVAHQEIDIFDMQKSYGLPGYTTEERDNFSTLLSSGFVDTYRHFYPHKRQFSHWLSVGNMRAKNCGWRLDYFLVSQPFLSSIVDSTIHNEHYGSDHCPV